MAPRGRPPKAKNAAKAKTNAVAVAATPEPEVKEMTLEEQAEKRTEIMKQMMDDQWYERQWDSQFAMHVIRERGFKCPPHSIQQSQTISKAVVINHYNLLAAGEWRIYQNSMLDRGWKIFEQFGIDFLTQPTCEWAKFQKWNKHKFSRIDISFAKDEISEQEFVQQLGEAYATMNGFQSTYWDKLRQDRIELEYQKWLSTVRQSVREEELPEDTVWDVEEGRVVLLHPDNSSGGIIKRIMKEQCHVSEDAVSHTQEWIARRVGSSKLIFGLSPEHRGRAPAPKTPSASENSDTEAGSPEAKDDEESNASEEMLEDANIVPSTEIRTRRRPLAKSNTRNKKFKDNRLPPLPNKGQWFKAWDEMTPAQKAKMREIHFGKNGEYHRQPKEWGSAPRNTPAPGRDPDNSGDIESADQTEGTSSQHVQHTAAAAQSTKGAQAMVKSGNSGPNAPTMLPANGDDDGSKPPRQGSGRPPKGECDEQGSMEDEDGPSDHDSEMSEVPSEDLDPEAEARVMGHPAASQNPPAKRGRGRPRKIRPMETQAPPAGPSPNSQPRQPPAQSNGVREDTIFSFPTTPPWRPWATNPEAENPGDDDSRPGNSGSNSSTADSRTNSGTPRAGNGGLSNPGPNTSTLGSLNGLQIQRPSMGPRPSTMNAWQPEALRARAIRRASQTPGPSGSRFTPVNEPFFQAQSSPPVQRTTFETVPEAQGQLTPSVQGSTFGNVQNTQAQPREIPTAHRTANRQDVGEIFVRDGNGSLAPAPQPKRGRRTFQAEHEFRPRPLPPSAFLHMDQLISPPEQFGNPAPRPRPQSVFNPSTQGYGVPMPRQRSPHEYSNMLQYPQQQHQMNGSMGSPMQHGNMAQRYVQNPTSQGFFEYHQPHQNMMQHGNSINYPSAFANNGNGAAQTYRSWPRTSSSSSMTSMISNQLDWYNGSANPLDFVPSSFSQQASMNGNGMAQSPRNVHNSMNGYGMAHLPPSTQSSMIGYSAQAPSYQHYGMTSSPNHYHHSSSTVYEDRQRLAELRQGQRMRQQRSQSGNRQIPRDQNRYDSLGRATNTSQNINNLSSGTQGPSRIPQPVTGQPQNGVFPREFQSHPELLASNNRQPSGALAGQPASMNINQTLHGPRPPAPTNGQPIGEKRGQGRPRKSPPQQAQTRSQTQTQVSVPTPAQTQLQSSQQTQTWGRDRSVYLGDPVVTPNGPLTFPPVQHIPSLPRGPPSDTGNLQSMPPVEQNHQHLSPEELREQNSQLAMVNRLGHSVQAAQPQLQSRPPQRQQNHGNSRNDLNDLSFSTQPENEDDILVQQHVPIVLGPQARQQARLPENGYASFMDFDDLFDFIQFEDAVID